MRRFALALVAVFAIALAGDSVWAQRGGAPGGGGRPPTGGAPGSAPGGGAPGGAWHGRPPGGPSGGGWHGAPPRGVWHGGGWRGGWYGPGVGIYLGGPVYWGGWWPYAYGYPYAYPYAYPGYVPAYPPVYIEKNEQPAPTNYWYYCQEPAGYYPYVRECGQAWITVVPQNVPVPPAPSTPPR
jgi:hypothetical protein